MLLGLSSSLVLGRSSLYQQQGIPLKEKITLRLTIFLSTLPSWLKYWSAGDECTETSFPTLLGWYQFTTITALWKNKH